MQHEMQIRGQLRNLELDFLPIRFVSNQSNVKGQIIKKQNYCLGWIAQDDTYVMLQNTTCPSECEVLRHISYEPGCNLSNLTISVFNLIHYADKIGATDEILLQMICLYLKKYRPTLLDTIDQRKNSLHAVIESLAFQCTTDVERATILHRLRNFSRIITEGFNACFVRFESLYLFFLQIDHPADAVQIRFISYYTPRIATPYLISNKCAVAWGKYVQDQVRLGETITKENSIKTISS